MKFLFGKNKKQIWEDNKKEFLQYFIEESGEKRIKNTDLEYRFHDSNGKVYYGFPDNLPLSLERWGKSRDFLMWMNTGISPDEFIELIDVAEKNWISYIKTGKNAAKVGYVFEELRNRGNMVLHTELLYNYLAVQLVREDEDPITFSQSLQTEKVAQFKKETISGNHYFFFQQPELRKLNEFWKFSQSEWEGYWNESLMKQELLKKTLETILSEQESIKEQKIFKTV